MTFPRMFLRRIVPSRRLSRLSELVPDTYASVVSGSNEVIRLINVPYNLCWKTMVSPALSRFKKKGAVAINTKSPSWKSGDIESPVTLCIWNMGKQNLAKA
jgi:hypothetical protein